MDGASAGDRVSPTGRPIVVGVDGSRGGRAALRWALAEAEVHDCPVEAMMVVHAPPVVAAGRPSTVGLAGALAGQPDDHRSDLLRDTVHDVLGDRHDPRLTATVVHGSPPETLCAAAHNARMLVVGSRGRGQVREAVLGSVAQFCVRRASCPVVVVPARLAETSAGADPASEAGAGGPGGR